MRRPVMLLTILLAALAGRAVAQCPDGTPPPCRGNTSASAPARRPNPPLDDRTWIVLPFENVARVQDIDWLKDASVNLLYLDMSKWRDIRVIDDERVADLIREVPEARAGLTLQSGMAVARRAGAGKLVMGDLLKVGSRTQIVAKVYDVRTGQRVRNVREETANPDSLMGMFGRLARGILNADAPSGASLGIGTTRLEAYQAYLEGVGHLNAFETVEAQHSFERALQLDSAFALAHYKLSIVIGWASPNNPGQAAHAEAAVRLGTSLPPRERTLIAAQAQSAAGDYGRACETLTPLVRADSADVEALYNIGECSYHDQGVVSVPGDTTRFMFRSSYNTSLRAFRRVLALDPTYHLAFQHIQDALTTGVRQGCPLGADGKPLCRNDASVFFAVVRRSGDSLVTQPVRGLVQAEAVNEQAVAAARDESRRRNLEEAVRAAQEWMAAGPNESRARIAYGRALLRLGRVNEASQAMSQVPPAVHSGSETAQFIADRFEIALKLDRPEEALRLADSIAAMASAPTAGQQLKTYSGFFSAMMGRPAVLDPVVSVIQGPPVVKSYFMSEFRAVLGVPDDSLFPREQALAALVGANRAQLVRPMANALSYHMRGRTAQQWPVSDTANSDTRVALVSWLAVGDTTHFRRALAAFDSILAFRRDEPDRGEAIISAEAHLVLGDSAAALAQLRRFRDVTWAITSALGSLGNGFGQLGMLWPRTFLLLGDLEAAAGNRAAAATAYRRFIGMWDKGEPGVQPVVARARESLARVSN